MAKSAEESRFFEVEPLEGESISHFLGRFRRQNYLTTAQLGKLTGLGAVISRWEKFYLNPFPTQQELEALAAVVEVDADKLTEMLPSSDDQSVRVFFLGSGRKSCPTLQQSLSTFLCLTILFAAARTSPGG